MPRVATAIPAIGKIRYRPVWLMICPARIDEPRIPNIRGTSSSPALLADAPLAICRNVGRYVTAPNMHTPTRNRTTDDSATVRIRKRRSGMAGSTAVRSTRRNAPPRTQRDDPQPDDGRRAPCVFAAGPRREQHETRDPSRQQRAAQPVDADRGTPAARREDQSRDHQGEDAERHVHEEDPPPREIVGEETTDERTDHARGTEDGSEESLVATAFARTHDVGDDRLRDDDQSAGTEALQRAAEDELQHRRREAGEHAADHEETDTGLEDDLPSEEVTELAEQRRRDRLRE